MFMRKEGQKERTMHENGNGTMMMRLHINGARYDVQLEPRFPYSTRYANTSG